MKKQSQKTNPIAELLKRKIDAQKSDNASSNSFRKFQPNKPRNENNSSVGPSWGGRKGN